MLTSRLPAGSTTVARRVRRAAATFGVLALSSLSIGAFVASPAAAAEPAPTMTFKGISLLGLLDSLAVSPTAVSVPSGGRLTFVNGASVPLTLSLGGQSYQLAKGASRTFTFQGASSAKQMKASAAALNIPLVGTLTSPTGTVNVAAAPRTTPPTTTPPQPNQPGPSQPGTPSNPGNPGVPSVPGPSTPAGGQVPPVLVPGAPQSPPSLGRSPVARGGMASADLPTATEEAGSASQDPTEATPEESASAKENVAGRSTEVTNVGGGIGLLILVATVLLGGVGSAAIRTVLAQRSVATRG